jgi:hypothetical protein
MTAPAHQPQLRFLALPALARVLPATACKRALHQRFHVLRQPQLEQVGDAATLRLCHHAFAGDAAVTAQQRWPAVARNAVNLRPQPRGAMGAGVLIARRARTG